MLNISSLTYRIAGRTLLEEARAQIPAGHRVGLIGRNGTGKSTLLGLIRGVLQPDGGDIELPVETRLGYVAQEAPAGRATPLEVVLEADTERARLMERAAHETDPDMIAEIHLRLVDIDAHAAPARAARILAGLGFTEAMQAQPMASYSGGWRMRVALAAVLFAEPDLLLLDEPTNHLDLEATVWLEDYLAAYPKTLVLVSHDRHILNSVVDHILHLDQRKLTYYPGGYDDFERLRAARLAQTKAAAASVSAKRQHLQAYVDRFRAQATKARQAQSRLKAIQRLATIELPPDDATVTFNFPEPAAMAPPLISLDRVSVGYTANTPILTGLDMRIDPDDRIALLGSNGNGKSTFAKLLAGRLELMAGHQHRAAKLKVGFFAQHQIEEMMPEESAFAHMARVMPNARDLEVRNRLGRFGFSGDAAFTKVGRLSGGERARLNLALVTHDAPNVLILDEPTNHLDIDSRRALADAINEYEGAVVLISHDWHLLELTADRLWLVADGRVKPFEGDLEEYRRQTLARTGTPQPAAKRDRPKGPKRRKSVEPLQRAARDAERALAAAERARRDLDQRLAAPNLTAQDRVALMRERTQLEGALTDAEAAWVSAEEALEAEVASS